ncbi:hypothetical protein N9L68_09130, partial [bacterium]|nr:hypothetical protein [bacterium]
MSTPQACQQFVGQPFTSEGSEETLLTASWIARRRYRAFTGRDPRRRRSPKRASWARGGIPTRRKGRGRFSRSSGPKGFVPQCMSSIGARSLAGGKGAGKKGSPRTGKGNGIDPAIGLQRTCFRCGSDKHMVGGCPEPKRKGKGKGKHPCWVRPTGITYMSDMAYHDVIRSDGSSEHYVTTSDSPMPLMAITDQYTVDYEPTGLDRAEPSDATIFSDDPWYRTQRDPWQPPIEEPHIAANTYRFKSDNSWISTAD